ncbi:MAG: CPBP family intramembrane metalloprotease [Oscillospiraceae bacterium]|nr:CPBP family intramembrane metalloprotease [Oscillospiraceae bacterium]
MILFANKVLSSIIQIILFTIIPFIWWLITARKKQKFTEWIGLKKIKGGKKTLISVIFVAIAFLASGILTLHLIKDIETATSEFAGLGVAAIPAIIVYATFNTAFPEELLFRGFLLKRLANKFGFNTANFIQALLFGLLHGAMFLSLAGILKAVLIIIFTGGVAWFMGYINEKNSDGSIIPSWIIHTVSNLFSGICAAFSII